MACCGWPPSPQRNAAIRAAAAEIADWNRFLLTARRHRVVGLAYKALSAAAIDLPSAIADKFAAQAAQIARQNLLLVREGVRLQQLLAAAGIPALILKGFAVAELAYGSLEAKQTRDLDFLVLPEQTEKTFDLLEREGFTFSAPAKHLNRTQRHALVRYGRDAELIQPHQRLLLDLQWRATSNPTLLQGVDAKSTAQTVTLPGGTTARTLASDDLFAYLCVHGAHHAWSRLKWLADFNALVAADGVDVERLYRHAQRLGAGLCAAQALLLCHRLFALNLPPRFATELSAKRRTRKLIAIAMKAMSAPYTETERDQGVAGTAKIIHRQFLLGQGGAFYCAQLRSLAIGPADIIRTPLPPELHFLYPILRVPLWLWRRARSSIDNSSAS